ncbi:MAG: flavodoxin-dependent (E)-4-hydroxy-3-methylbut-2-enyl-diphosphate synthase [Flavonifractor plautii]
MTKQIMVGGVPVGGGAPVTIQSMTNTRTDDVTATLEQIRRLAAAGCEIIRVAVPDQAAARAVGKIKEESPIPVVVDIHFDYKLALRYRRRGGQGAHQPGEHRERDRQAVADARRQRNIPIRIGVMEALEKEILAKYGRVCPEAMVESALDISAC